MPVPLYQAKAEFFRMLGHPVRIRVLELLQSGPMPVRELLARIEVEPAALSQQLAVLRRSGIVTSTREGSTVVYTLAGGDVAQLMQAARRILTEMLTGQGRLLAELREGGTAHASDTAGASDLSVTCGVSGATGVPAPQSCFPPVLPQ
ncbi:metalloregulator ArsR/SmtB family transcription factor [Streptomyces sp. NBC_00250]|uniref:ArsR/SmtB family transcription factor n=1 Tax=Streptomyces sp. NBC_00250 TaxID=2903641 RepID=UPI002E2DDA95|nr:metalloregulator ArsR/SmtB family transcription factor [Streptomyces sp. NBC_00250]